MERSGVLFVFDDGTHLSKPSQRVDMEERKQKSIYDMFYQYTSDIMLTEDEVKMFSEHKLSKIRLCNCEESVDAKFADDFKDCSSVILKIE